MREELAIVPRTSKQIFVGSVPVGGGAPISVQTMTNTDTADVQATIAQVRAVADAGADMVRVSVPELQLVEAFAAIRKASPIPVIADVHFDHSIALGLLESGVDCLRINPGNIGSENKIKEVLAAATHHNTPIRIGINAGSLEKDLQVKYGEPNSDALLESALRQIGILQKYAFENYKISVKASDISMMIKSYQKLARVIEQPIHLGVTEAGGMRNGSVKSALGIGYLLIQGIGDTLRVSLAADPVEEVKVGWDILKSLHLRARGVNIIACPSCSRQNFNVIDFTNQLDSKTENIKSDIDVAIIGCFVNGPGEAKNAHIGVTGGSPLHLVYKDGKPYKKVDTSKLVDTIAELAWEFEKNNLAKLEASTPSKTGSISQINIS